MPLSWSEIRDRAVAFSREYAVASSEKSLSQHYWRDFFNVFGVDGKKVSAYEAQVKLARAEGKFSHGWIDVFWRGKLLIEMKSAGQNLERAYAQALEYFDNLPARDLPRAGTDPGHALVACQDAGVARNANAALREQRIKSLQSHTNFGTR